MAKLKKYSVHKAICPVCNGNGFVKIIKNKHIIMTLSNNFGSSIKAVAFNSIDTILGDNLINSKKKSINVLATIKRDN